MRERFIDPTDKAFSARLEVPLGLGDRPALVLDPAGPRLVAIPPYPAGSSTLRWTRTLAVEGDALDVEERVEYDGYWAGFVRRRFLDSAPEGHQDLVRDMLGLLRLARTARGATADRQHGHDAVEEVRLPRRHEQRAAQLVVPHPDPARVV